MGCIGGIGSRFGPLVGAVLLIAFTQTVRLIDVPPDQLKFLVAVQPIAIGLLLVGVLRFRPEGLFPEGNAFGARARQAHTK